MTDFEKCCEDLTKWGIDFETGKFYDDNDMPKKKYIYTGCEYIKFDLKGNYIDTD